MYFNILSLTTVKNWSCGELVNVCRATSVVGYEKFVSCYIQHSISGPFFKILWLTFLTWYIPHCDYIISVAIVCPFVFLTHLLYAPASGVVELVGIGIENVVCLDRDWVSWF